MSNKHLSAGVCGASANCRFRATPLPVLARPLRCPQRLLPVSCRHFAVEPPIMDWPVSLRQIARHQVDRPTTLRAASKDAHLPAGLGAGQVTSAGQMVYPDAGAEFDLLAENTRDGYRTVARIKQRGRRAIGDHRREHPRRHCDAHALQRTPHAEPGHRASRNPGCDVPGRGPRRYRPDCLFGVCSQTGCPAALSSLRGNLTHRIHAREGARPNTQNTASGHDGNGSSHDSGSHSKNSGSKKKQQGQPREALPDRTALITAICPSPHDHRGDV